MADLYRKHRALLVMRWLTSQTKYPFGSGEYFFIVGYSKDGNFFDGVPDSGAKRIVTVLKIDVHEPRPKAKDKLQC